MKQDSLPVRGRRRLHHLALLLRVIGAVAIVALLGLWYWLERDTTAERIRVWIESSASDLVGAEVSIGSLDLDVLPFHLRADHIVVGDPEAPVAAAARLTLEISPWGLLEQRVVVTDMTLERPYLALPHWTSRRGRPREAAAVQLQLRRLTVHDGQLQLGGVTAGFEGELTGIDLDLRPDPGLLPRMATASSGQLRVGGGRLLLSSPGSPARTLEPVALHLQFELRGSTLRVNDLQLGAGSSSIRGQGTVIGANADLQLQADVAVDDIFDLWVPPGAQDHAGRAVFRGDLQVRDGMPFLSGRLQARDARMAGVALDTVRLDLVLAPDSVSLRNAAVSLYGGTLNGTLEVDRGTAPATVTIDYEARDIDTAALTELPALPGWRLAGRVSGRGRIGWQAPFTRTARGDGELQLELPDARTLSVPHPYRRPESEAQHVVHAPHPTPALPLPTHAELQYHLTDGTLELRRASLSLPSSNLSVLGSLDLDGALQLTARVDTSDLRQVDHLAAQYRSYRGTPGPRLGVSGAASARLEIGGTLARPTISGVVRSDHLATRTISLGAVTTTLSTTADGRLLARPLRIDRGAGSTTGSASISIPAGGYRSPPSTYEVRLRLAGYPLDARVARLAGRLGAGEVSGDVLLAGPLATVGSGHVQLRATAVTVGSLKLAAARVTARRLITGWDVSDLQLRDASGELQAQAAITPTGKITYLRADAVDLDVASLVGGIGSDVIAGGRLDLTADLRGDLQAPDGTAAMTWHDATLAAVPVGLVAIRARTDGGLISATALAGPDDTSIERLTPPRPSAMAQLPRLPPAPSRGWRAALNLRLGAPTSAQLRLRADFAALVPLLSAMGSPLPAGLDLDGALRFDGEGLLDSIESWSGTATLSEATLRRGATGASLLAGARVDAGILQGTADLQTGEDHARVEAQLDLGARSVAGRVTGRLNLSSLTLARDGIAAAGAALLDLRFGGVLPRPTFEGSLRAEQLSLDLGNGYPITATSVDSHLADGVVRVESLRGQVAGTPFHGSATLPLPWAQTSTTSAANLRLGLDALPLGPLLARSPGWRQLITDASLETDLDVYGDGLDPASWNGTVTLRGLDLQMRDYRLRLADEVQAQLRSGTLMLPDSTLLRGGRTALHLAGSVSLSPVELDVTAHGPIGLEPLNVLSPYWGTGGVADIDLRVRGTPPDLAYRGTAAVREAVLSPPPLRQPIEQLRGQLVFEDRRVRIEHAEGILGGGRVDAGGEIFLRDSRPQSFRLAATVDNALLRIERDVRVQASADVVYDGTPESSLLSGQVRLAEGIYRRNLDAGDALLEMFEAPETGADPLLSSIRLDLRVQGSGNLFIDNNLADVDVTADFDIRGNLAKPVALGRSRLLRGRLYWNGNTFEVLQGVAEFNNPFETEAVFEIRSRTEIRRYTIDLSFSGSLTRGVTFNYTSTPPLSDLDLFNLLAFGEEPSSAVLQDPYRYQRALGLQATRYLADAYLTEVERGAERLFGVDRFRISPTLTGSETDATARMTLGKRINRNLYVTYSRLLSTSEDQLLTLEYQLTPELRIKGTRDEDGSFGIDFLVQRRIR